MAKCMRWMVFAAILLPASARAHGVLTRVTAGDTTVVTVTHEDGEPLAGASFTVRAPGGDAPYLQGTTDARGRLAFHPDRPGDWTVRVATADGHGAVVKVAVAPPTPAAADTAAVGTAARPGTTAAASPPARPAASPMTAHAGSPRLLRALGGALLLVGVFALGARLSRRRGG